MNYRAPGGPSAAEVGSLFQTFAQTARIVAISMSTWNPELDRDSRSQAVCMGLLQSVTGQPD